MLTVSSRLFILTVNFPDDNNHSNAFTVHADREKSCTIGSSDSQSNRWNAWAS